MAVSNDALARMPLVKTVDETIDAFLTEWQLAAHGALMIFAPKGNENDDADRQWWIQFAGNMIWAWTVFCPTAAGNPLIITKLASVLGAALAGGAASKLLYQGQPDELASAAGKQKILEALATQATTAEVAIKKISESWSKTDLLPYIYIEATDYLRSMSPEFRKRELYWLTHMEDYWRKAPPGDIRWGQKFPQFVLNDDELFNWFNGNDGGGGDQKIKSKIWYDLVFVSGTVKYETRRSGLLFYFRRRLDSYREQYEAQLELYDYHMRNFISDRAQAGHPDGQYSLGLYKDTHPFKFQPSYGVRPKGDLLTAQFQTPSEERIPVPGAGI